MKVVVFSDAHGNRRNVERILDFNPDADYFISLGDSQLQEDFLHTNHIIHVKGNMSHDPGSLYNMEIKIEEILLFLTHGHLFKVHNSLDRLIHKGVMRQYDVVLFGHTHQVYHMRTKKIVVLNPGSCTEPRNLLPPTYAILEIIGKDVSYTFKDAITNHTLEV